LAGLMGGQELLQVSIKQRQHHGLEHAQSKQDRFSRGQPQYSCIVYLVQ
jgi:CRISPR/Cas system-associated protein endoribonuclease Cas2